jgi:hypothetical protein
MTNSMHALITKLSWQLQEVNQGLEALSNTLKAIQDKQQANAQEIQQARASTALMNPEQEIARLNFIMRCQQNQDRLDLEKKDLVAQQLHLNARQLRLSTELKMLEKYQLQQQRYQQQEANGRAQKNSDEQALGQWRKP